MVPYGAGAHSFAQARSDEFNPVLPVLKPSKNPGLRVCKSPETGKLTLEEFTVYRRKNPAGAGSKLGKPDS